MFETLTVCVLVGVGTLGAVDPSAADPGAATAWWNADWACRAKLTADSGFYKRQDLLLSREINFDDWLKKAGVEGAFDAKSPRVLWLHGGGQEEVPSRFIPGQGSAAQGMLLWQRPGTMATMTKEQFFIYFDALRGAGKPAPKPCSLELPGNLIVNPGFEQADPKDPARPLGWEFPPQSDTTGVVEWVKGVSHSGQYSLKVTNLKGSGSFAPTQWVNKVRPDRRYVLSGWIKCDEKSAGGIAIIAAYFYGPDHQDVAKGSAYGNGSFLRYINAGRGETPWVRISVSSIEYRDVAHQVGVDLPRTAPGTGSALIRLRADYGKACAYFDDVELKEAPEGAPAEIVVEAVEKK